MNTTGNFEILPTFHAIYRHLHFIKCILFVFAFPHAKITNISSLKLFFFQYFFRKIMYSDLQSISPEQYMKQITKRLTDLHAVSVSKHINYSSLQKYTLNGN